MVVLLLKARQEGFSTVWFVFSTLSERGTNSNNVLNVKGGSRYSPLNLVSINGQQRPSQKYMSKIYRLATHEFWAYILKLGDNSYCFSSILRNSLWKALKLVTGNVQGVWFYCVWGRRLKPAEHVSSISTIECVLPGRNCTIILFQLTNKWLNMLYTAFLYHHNAFKCYITQEVLISGKDSHGLVKQANMGINAIFEYNNCSRCPICMSQILVAQVAKQTIWTRTLFNVLQNLLFGIDSLRNHFEIKSHGFQ